MCTHHRLRQACAKSDENLHWAPCLAKDLRFLQAGREDSDQTEHSSVFSLSARPKVHFLMLQCIS